MLNQGLLTIEILGDREDQSTVLDRVIGGTTNLDHAKRIGEHLFAIVDGDIPPRGFRVLGPQRQVLYEWFLSDDEQASN